MKKARLLLLFLVGFSVFFPWPGIKSNPFGLPMERNHAYELMWDNGHSLLGMGTRTTFGFPYQAIVIDTASLRAAEANQLVPGEPKKTDIDSWRAKLDLMQLMGDVIFAAVLVLVLNGITKAGQLSKGRTVTG